MLVILKLTINDLSKVMICENVCENVSILEIFGTGYGILGPNQCCLPEICGGGPLGSYSGGLIQ